MSEEPQAVSVVVALSQSTRWGRGGARWRCEKFDEEGGQWGVTQGPALAWVMDSEHWGDQQS